ncbi:MAG: TIR domain-containing protein [Hyphomonadaceae bacterium]
MTDIFLSYRREDRAQAISIAQALRKEGLDVFFDADLEGGVSWVTELNDRLQDAHVVIVLWSQGSLDSPHVNAEALIGFERQALVPVAIESGLKIHAPFNILQTTDLAGWTGEATPEWRKFAATVSERVEDSRAARPLLSANALSDNLKMALELNRSRIRELVEPLRAVAGHPDVRLAEIDEELAAAGNRLNDTDLFTIVVVGRMKVGKSTLINALLGPADAVDAPDGPLPTDDFPCTATLSRLHFAEKPYVRPLSWSEVEGADAKSKSSRKEWRFRDYHERARIYVGGKNNSATFDEVAEFDIGWPAPLLRNGVCLVDSPGIGEHSTRTSHTRRAIATTDAAIVVYRSDMLAGMDEIEFAKEVTQKAGKVFTLVNVRGSHDMPPSESLVNVTRERLALKPDRSFESQDVYFANFWQGLRAGIDNDRALGERSGLTTVQVRLARFLITERMPAQVRRTLRIVAPAAAQLLLALNDRVAAASTEEKALRKVLSACEDDLSKIRKRRAVIDDILKTAERASISAAHMAFEAKTTQLLNEMPTKIAARSIPGIDGFWKKVSAGTVGGKDAVKTTIAMIQGMVEQEFDAWASAPADQAGLAQALDGPFSQMSNGLRDQVEQIGEIIQGMHTRIQSLTPSLDNSQGDLYGSTERAISVVAGTLLFGPLGGIMSSGGWRSVAGGAAGAIGVSVLAGIGIGLAHLAFPPAWVATAIGVVGAALGAVFGSMAGLQKRLKDKAWEQVRPQLAKLGRDADARRELERHLQGYFRDVRERMAENLGKLVDAERNSLDQLKALAGKQKDKERLQHLYAEFRASVEKTLADVQAMDAEFERAAPRGL